MSVAPEFQFSTPEHKFVAVFQFIQLITPEATSSGDIGAVDASQVADKVVSSLFDNFGMPARNAIKAMAQRGKIYVDSLPLATGASEHQAIAGERKLPAVGHRYQSGPGCRGS